MPRKACRGRASPQNRFSPRFPRLGAKSFLGPVNGYYRARLTANTIEGRRSKRNTRETQSRTSTHLALPNSIAGIGAGAKDGANVGREGPRRGAETMPLWSWDSGAVAENGTKDRRQKPFSRGEMPLTPSVRDASAPAPGPVSARCRAAGAAPSRRGRGSGRRDARRSGGRRCAASRRRRVPRCRCRRRRW